MGKRILVAVALLLAIAATGCKGVADDVVRSADDAVRNGKNLPDRLPSPHVPAPDSEPGSSKAPQLGPDDVKDGIEAGCRLKDSSEVNNTDTDRARGNAGVEAFCDWAG
jgi:hypothetical protein